MTHVLHVLSDRARGAKVPLEEALWLAALGGADVIQVREKKAPALAVFEFARELLARLREAGSGARVLVNDRLDVALAAGADGVHLAAKSLPVAAAREVVQRAGGGLLLGCSVHSLEEARAAEAAGADYVTFGHIFPTASHPGLPPKGVRELARVVEALAIPVVAIGGIDAGNVAEVLATGASGVAVIGAVVEAADPRAAAARLKEAMARCAAAPKVPFPAAGGGVRNAGV
ncbi:thiamine phosphate synthase [Alicyclobacillus sendaiensis]|uniref:Thiamine-phosphate synthase n=1 Tax=Alicyclobacillus sendaiensis PA2 TaxID=3029425 RepID=A0ABT6XWK1_ALISE|nr:thiamine phosphate synthase [Alicyclobacillus sendaiensis]MDI9259463.1 thiamine phosphate synthase [Alicyclobacillus sendaiensis PA2]